MAKGVSQIGKDIVEKELTTMFESKWLRSKAIETGLVERERKIGSSLNQVGRLNCNFPSLRYIISMRFFVVLKPLALLFAD